MRSTVFKPLKNPKNVSDSTMCIHVLVASLMFHQFMRMCTCAKLKIEDVLVPLSILSIWYPKLVEHAWQLHSFIFIHTKQILSMESGSSRRPPQHTKITMGKLHAEVGNHWATKWLFNSAAYDG